MSTKDYEHPSPDALFALLQARSLEPAFHDIAQQPEISRTLQLVHPIAAASYFAGLQLDPCLQSNSCRLEALVSICYSSGTGTEQSDKRAFKCLFDALTESFFGYSEDPAEDLFVTTVSFGEKSFKILEGIWESSAHHLDCFLRVIERYPNNSPRFTKARDSVLALLKISDFIISRDGLARNVLGNEMPLKALPNEGLEPTKIINKITLTEANLAEIGVNKRLLKPFLHNQNDRKRIGSHTSATNLLNFRPLIENKSSIVVLMPCSLSIAIRNYIIEFHLSYRDIRTFSTWYKNEYFSYLKDNVSILGTYKELKLVNYEDLSKPYTAPECIARLGSGKYIQFLFYFDDYDGYHDGYFNGISPHRDRHEAYIQNRIKQVSKSLSRRANFRGGISVIVCCGWGRVMLVGESDPDTSIWRVECISSADLETISGVPDMDAFTYWRLLDSKTILEERGIQLQNINGILNLFGYVRENNFHIVPHDQIGEDLDPMNLENLFIGINQNSLLNVRAEVAQGWDRHRITDYEKRPIDVQRITNNVYINEDKSKPIFASLTDIRSGRLLGLVYGVARKYWCSPAVVDNTQKDLIYRIWDMLCLWLYPTDECAGELISTICNWDIVWLWTIDFSRTNHSNNPPPYEKLLTLVESTVQFESGKIRLETAISSEFLDGFRQEANFAERALIHHFLETLFSIRGNEPTKEVLKIIDQIFCSSLDARRFHMLPGTDPIDRFKDRLPEPIFINDFDNATTAIGLGWLARDPSEGPFINGVKDCTTYLRVLVSEIWHLIRTELRQFARGSTVYALLLNHESLDSDSLNWRRTFKAMYSLHKDKEEVSEVVSREIAKRNGGTLASRLAIEMALCECPVDSGYDPDELDLSKLISLAFLMHEFGGWSDAIHYGAIPAKIRIAPTGNVIADTSFFRDIVQPHGMQFQSILLGFDAENYASNFAPPREHVELKESLDNKFIDAWNVEFGFQVDTGIEILNQIERLGLDLDSPVVSIAASEFATKVTSPYVSARDFAAFLEAFTLRDRNDWTSIPPNFCPADISPWRFKRRLSAIYRPILYFNDTYYFAPSMVRKAFRYRLVNLYDASFDDSLFTSRQMRSWIGHKRDKYGHEFNLKVADTFRSVGWSADSDIKVKHLLNMGLPLDYGDVDVVAWNSSSNTVLIIECKDLDLAKTPSEIARQLHEFKGEIVNGKPDRLKRHLTRCEVIQAHPDRLQKYVGLSEAPKIVPMLIFNKIVPMSITAAGTRNKIKVLLSDQILSYCEGVL